MEECSIRSHRDLSGALEKMREERNELRKRVDSLLGNLRGLEAKISSMKTDRKALAAGVRLGRKEILSQLREGAPSSWCTYQIRNGLANEIERTLGLGLMSRRIARELMQRLENEDADPADVVRLALDAIHEVQRLEIELDVSPSEREIDAARADPCNACDEYMRGRAEALAEAVAKAESYAREHLNYDDDQILSKGVPDALRDLK